MSNINDKIKNLNSNQLQNQNQKKIRYQLENTNNFICYEKLRLLVSEPWKYFAIHVIIILGMVYFYSLTFIVGPVQLSINYIIVVLHCITFLLMISLGFKNPGIILKIKEDFQTTTKINIPFDRNSKPAINEDVKSYVVSIRSHNISLKFCSECLIFKPPRTVHCWVCNACIANMDHHCPFIGNCVGKNNYQLFFWYVLTLTTMNFLIIIQLIMIIVKLFQSYQAQAFHKPEIYFIFALLCFAIVTLLFVGILCGFHFYLITNSMTTNELCKNTWNTVSGNPFQKNFCIKNFIKFIVGPTKQLIPQPVSRFHQTMLPRALDKSEKYFSSYKSDSQTSEQKNKQIEQFKGNQYPDTSKNLHQIMQTDNK